MPTRRSGGRLSSDTIKSYDRSRFAGVAGAHAGRTIGELEWRPAQVGSIQRDEQRRTWQTGNVRAVLSDGQAIIAGGQSGGVWLINPIPSPSFRDGYRAIPLSDRWDTTHVQSLAYGPEGARLVFVGCRAANSLFLIEFQAVPGALVVVSSDLAIPLPFQTTVHAIVVFADPRRIVIGTDGGVFWSEIPVAIADVASYVWTAAAGLPSGPCLSLSPGAGNSLAASAAEPVNPAILDPTAPTPPDRLHTGTWQDGVLTFALAKVPDVAKTQASLFVLTSCATAPSRMYAVAMADDGTIRCVLRSDSGGQEWAAVSVPPGAGDQGYHDRAIAGSPYRPDVVALGWQTGGPFLSMDGGAHWRSILAGDDLDQNGQPCYGSRAALHDDIQALTFPLNALRADILVIASDGGVLMTRDLGRCFDSEYSRSLAILQFYGPGHFGSRGTLSVSSRFPGLLAGGTQDNGNLTLHPDADAGPVWHRLVGGDGGITRFVDPLAALLHVSSGQPHVRLSTWDPSTHRFDGAGIVVPRDGDPAGLAPASLEAVIAPTWGRPGQLLYACAGSSDGHVHGLFVDDGSPEFLLIGRAGQAVSSVASFDGAGILVGMSDGRILLLDAQSRTFTTQAQDAASEAAGGVVHFEPLSSQLAYALKNGILIRFNGQIWTALPATKTWITFTVERVSGRLFAATERDVFASADGGVSWSDASIGLPVAANCTDLRIGDDGDGGRSLYLTTYGRSAWRAKITLPETGPILDLPPHQRELLIRLIEEAGGIVRLGEQLIGIPAGQPATDVLAGLAVEAIAKHMSPESSRAIRLTTLRQMVHVISREIERVEQR